MTTLRELKESVTEMSDEKLSDTLTDQRKRRRSNITESAKKKKAKAKKPRKTKAEQLKEDLLAKGFSEAEIEEMLG